MRSPFVIPSSGQNGLSRFEKRSSRRPRFTTGGRGTRSGRTSAGALSSRSRRYEGARRRPSCVHSANSTSATRTGSTQVMSDFRTRGIFGTSAKGESARSSGRRSSRSRSISRSEKPVPTLPAQRSSPASCTPATSAPNPRFGGPVRGCTPRSRPPASGEASASATRESGDPAGRANRPAWRRRPRALARARPRGAPPRPRTAARRRLPALRPMSCSSRFLRSASGSSRSCSDSSSRRSKRTRTELPAPSWRSEKRERPFSSSAQISPSRTASDERTARAAARAASRNRPVKSLPLRLVSVTSPPDTVTIARKPSHLGS